MVVDSVLADFQKLKIKIKAAVSILRDILDTFMAALPPRAPFDARAWADRAPKFWLFIRPSSKGQLH